MSLLYKLLGKRFEKQFLENQVKNQNQIPELSFALTDSNGVNYYRYASEMVMPVDRFNKLQEYLVIYSNGISNDSLNMLIEKANKALSDGLSKLKQSKHVNAITIGKILYEIQSRQDMVKPMDLFINMIAVQLVREDEDPNVFFQTVHSQKVNDIVSEIKKGNNFFFQTSEWKRVFGHINMSPDEWTKYLQDQEEKLLKLKPILDGL